MKYSITITPKQAVFLWDALKLLEEAIDDGIYNPSSKSQMAALRRKLLQLYYAAIDCPEEEA